MKFTARVRVVLDVPLEVACDSLDGHLEVHATDGDAERLEAAQEMIDSQRINAAHAAVEAAELLAEDLPYEVVSVLVEEVRS